MENGLLSEYGMQRVSGVDQLFVRLLKGGTLGLLVTKVLYDFLLFGTKNDIQNFFSSINPSFSLGAAEIGKNLRFLGCTIEVEIDGSVSLGTSEYLKCIRPISISRHRQHQPLALVDDRKMSEYRSLTGTLLYLGQAGLPQAFFATSKL